MNSRDPFPDEELRRRIMDFIMAAGQTLLENGAEVFRVEQTMEIMARSFHLREFHVYVLTNGIFASAGTAEISEVRNVPVRTTHLGRVAAVNALSREIAETNMSLGEAEYRLAAAQRIPFPKDWVQLVSGMGGAFSFAMIFGGDLRSAIAAAVAGVDCDYRQVLVLHGGKNLLCQRAALCRSAHHPRVGQNHPHSNGHQRKREEEHPCARVPLPAAPHRTAGRLLFSVNCHLFFLTTLWRPRIRLAVCVLPCRMRCCLNLPLPVMQGKCSRSWFHSIKRCSSAFCYNFCAEIFSY